MTEACKELSMKSANEILKAMGFHPDSREQTQEAFYKYLLKDMQRQSPANNDLLNKKIDKLESAEAQLAFDLEACG